LTNISIQILKHEHAAEGVHWSVPPDGALKGLLFLHHGVNELRQ
jgi:hypothetical protein